MKVENILHKQIRKNLVNHMKISESQVIEKGWLQITKTSNAMQFQDACPEIDESLIKKPRIGGCRNKAETVFLSSETAIDSWEIIHLCVW